MVEAHALLEGRGLVKRYPGRGRHAAVTALDGVDLRLVQGESLGVIGRSGAGKSTLVRVLLGLERPDGGEVLIAGRAIAGLRGRELRGVRRTVQVVFQDPAGSLDPRAHVLSIVGEPLAVHRIVPAAARPARVAELLEMVGLPDGGEFLLRRPHELSGGERQRVAIARALALGPRGLVLDEPVSALDVSIQGQIVDLVLELRRQLGLALLLVAHDVALVRALCDRVAVIAAGRIVEQGPADSVLDDPRHPDTRVLIAAARERWSAIRGPARAGENRDD